MPCFIVKINKLGIYYFYLNNLALEDKKFWVRKFYNQKFLSATGPLTSLEKKEINRYQKTILRLEKAKKSVNLADFFYRPNPWQSLKKEINKNDFEIVFKTFQLFSKRFNSFWSNELKNEALIGRKNLINNLEKEIPHLRKTCNNLKILYAPSIPSPKKIYIFLIPLPKTVIGGGGKFIPFLNGLSIEGSGARMAKIRTIEIILHELIHLCFEENYRKRIVQFIKEKLDKIEQNQLIKSFNIPSVEFGIREITAASLTIKATSKTKTASPYRKLLFYTSQKLQPFIKHYLKNKKPLDENFIKEILKFWRLYLTKELIFL